MENIDNIFQGDGIPPVFSAREIAMLQKRADSAKVVHVPNSATGYTKGIYHVKVFNFVDSYRRNKLPWGLMTRAQREWLLKIKDSLK